MVFRAMIGLLRPPNVPIFHDRMGNRFLSVLLPFASVRRRPIGDRHGCEGRAVAIFERRLRIRDPISRMIGALADRAGRGTERASTRIAIRGRQPPFPVLDIRIDPRHPESGFPDGTSPAADFPAETGPLEIGGQSARETAHRRAANGEIAFVFLWLDGVVFHFAAEPGLQDFRASP
jgi:hypothetical protein